MSKRHVIIEHLTIKDLKRLFSKIKISTSIFYKGTPCWEWIASVSSLGYGQFHWGDGMVAAHRFTYQWLIGGLQAGIDQEVDHLCRNRKCCNPIHLEAVSHKENTIRGISFVAINANKTHCVNGHQLDESNTFWQVENKRSRRRCRSCYAATQAKRVQKKSQERAIFRASTQAKFKRGSEHPQALLTESTVQQIRALNKEGLGYIKLGRLFNVHPQTIANIVKRHTWSHVA